MRVIFDQKCEITPHVGASFLPAEKLRFISVKRLQGDSAQNTAENCLRVLQIYRMVQCASAPIAAPSQSQTHESGQKRGCASGNDGIDGGLDAFAQPVLPPVFGQPMYDCVLFASLECIFIGAFPILSRSFDKINSKFKSKDATTRCDVQGSLLSTSFQSCCRWLLI